MSPLVSIVIPFYNEKELIFNLLKHLKNQTYKNWECIVVNDGSDCNKSEFGKKVMGVDKRINYIYQDNMGVSAARNTGVKKSKGTYIQFIDSDDDISINKIENAVKLFTKNKNVDGVCCGFQIAGKKKSKNKILSGESFERNKLLEKLIEKNIFMINSIVFKKSVFEKLGGFRTGLSTVEDWDFWLRFVENNFVIIGDTSKDSIAYVTDRKDSLSKDIRKMLANSLRVRCDFKKRLTDKKLIEINSHRIDDLIYRIGLDELKQKKYLAGTLKLIKTVPHLAWYKFKKND